jgi:hypothetical protein
MISFPHCCGLKEPDKYVLNHFRIEVRIISVLETVAVRSNLFRQRRNMASNTTGDNVTNEKGRGIGSTESQLLLKGSRPAIAGAHKRLILLAD